MVEIGKLHRLSVTQRVDAGVMLDADGHELFLPAHLVDDDVSIGDRLEVMVYVDREGAPQATTWTPAATVGEIAYLRCVSVTRAGAYLDWGIPKDLYVPPGEQTTRMVEGRKYVVAVCLDRKGERLMGSAHLARHFDYDVDDVAPGDEVDLLVYGHDEPGVRVVVDRRHRGLIHRSELHRTLPMGTELRGYVRGVRHDNRIDVGLTRVGVGGISDAKQAILTALEAAGGRLPLHDRSSPDDIQRVLGMSKKAFKRGVGGLYKERRITMGDGEIRLVTE